MIALTVPELLPILLPGPQSKNLDGEASLAWSVWRRRHQARARWYHYRRRYALVA